MRRIDAELVRRGLARSRRHATELLAAGRVTLDGALVTKPSAPVEDDGTLGVATDPDDPGYASRAAHKLAGVLDAVADVAGAPHVHGARCLDLGASTGGFTDVLLRRGARHVVAVDVGHGQLVARLRQDTRVTVHEGVNVRELTPQITGPVPDLVVADLSFISLTTVLPAVARVLGLRTQLLVMVKPQFEVGRERLGRGGVVRDPVLHRDTVVGVAQTAARAGLCPVAVVPSALPGPSGNREFFLWLRVGESCAEFDGSPVEAAVAWDPDGSTPPPVFFLTPARSTIPVPAVGSTASATLGGGSE